MYICESVKEIVDVHIACTTQVLLKQKNFPVNTYHVYV